MNRKKLTKALSKIGFIVSHVNQIMNDEGKWLPFFVNIDSVNSSATGEGWSVTLGYDHLEIREMFDNDGDISAISLVNKGAKTIEQADTFFMFHRTKFRK